MRIKFDIYFIITPGFNGISSIQYLVFCVVYSTSLFFICSFSFGHLIVCPSSIYVKWYLYAFLKESREVTRSPIRNTEDDRKSTTYSFNQISKREHNIWIVYLVMEYNIRFLEMERNVHIKNKYHILEKQNLM